uniref:Uncharacterized protein n=1 Tax=Heterorhabditis bacteriophora TaxID=37862 RepID=A0A1I7XEA8_HETBA
MNYPICISLESIVDKSSSSNIYRYFYGPLDLTLKHQDVLELVDYRLVINHNVCGYVYMPHTICK